MVKLHDTDAACTRHEFVRDLSDFKVSKHSRIFGAMALFLTRRVFSSFLSFSMFFPFSCLESVNISNRNRLQAHNEMMSKSNQSPSNPTIPLEGWP